MSNTMNNGDILIISLHDNDRYLQLSGVMAVAWQMIDGKTNWKKIIDAFSSHQYDTEEIQSICKIISHIIKNEDFKIVEKQAFKTGDVQIMTLAHPHTNPTYVYADAYDDIGIGSNTTPSPYIHSSNTDTPTDSIPSNWQYAIGRTHDDFIRPEWGNDGTIVPNWAGYLGHHRDNDIVSEPHDPN